MAEFALGLTKTAVEGTVSRVKLAIDEETRLKVKVQNDLMFITGEFQMMQSFLNVANKERAKNEVVRTWVRQIRDLAFDVEDCVELVVSLDIKPGWSWLWRVVPSCMAPPRALDQAVAEIHLLKARVQDVSQRNTRYHLIGSDGVSVISPGSAALDQQPPTSLNILHDVWEAAGEDRFTRDLKHLITSEGTDLQVISVWVSTSIPGGGASAAHPEAEAAYVIKEAYDDTEIRQEFKTRAWVKLMHPFDPDEFLESLLTQLYCNSQRPNIGAELGQKMKAAVAMEHDKLMQQLRQQRYLVILEGVTAVVEWDAIRMYLPDTNNGSRIVVYTAQHIRLARFCTGEPYRVSELTRISDCQSLCAFSNKLSVHRSDMGELNWQIRRGGVISVLCGDDVIDCREKLHRICQVYKYIMHKRKEFHGLVEFKEQSWVDVPDPFDMQAFSVRLFLDFQRRDFQANEIAAVGEGGHQAIVKRCCRYLREDDCLVVINGLQSKIHWDEINKIFFLSGEPITKGTSIIVITKEESVAKHCVDHKQDRVFDIEKDVDTDKALHRLTKDYECCGIGGKEDSRRAHLLFHDPGDVFNWVNCFELVGRQNEVAALERQIQDPGVISVWGHSGVGKSVIVKMVYYSQMYFTCSLFEEFSFVDVPDGDPFDLTDFSWHLLLDFYSRDPEEDSRKKRDPEAKEKVVISLYKGKQNPIQECCRLLQQKKCLVVIDGLRSEDDWDKIRATFLSSDQPTQGCIVVITNDESVARHCVVDDRVLGVERLRVLRHRPLTELGPPVRFLYDREEEAHTSWATEYHLVGRDEETSWLRYKTSVLSVWGLAGVGKSALVRHAYRFNSHRSRSWVDVPCPFHLTEFSRRLLMGFHSNDLQAMEIAAVGIMEGQDTVLACCKILHEYYDCFLVIDGLRSTHDWDLIRASFLSEHTDQRSCTIVVISNEASVATHCASHDKWRVLNVKCLNAAHSLRLFKEIAWGVGKNQLTTEESEFSEAILAKCGGLPKVIAAIGEHALTSISTEKHHDFIGKLETDSRFQSLRGLFCWMQSYFDGCSDLLKPCIFYLSIFQNIRRGRMLRRWIAEGYSTDTSATGTAEDNGETLFAELVESSIIQQQQTPRSRSKMVYQVNGFFLEYIKSRPMEDNLVFALEGHCRPNMQRTGQHLAIMSSWDRDQIVFESMDLTRLRSLTVFGGWRSFFISSDTKMRLLRVLDLEDTYSGVTDDVLEQIPKLLPRLKFLSVRGCQYITRVPDCLGWLRQLQTLDVRHTKIRVLPRAIIELVKLQYLRAGTTNTSLGEGPDDSDVPVVADVDGASTNQAAADRDGASTSQKAAGDGDGASISQIATGDGDGAGTTQTAAVSDGGVTRTSQTIVAKGDGRSTRQTTAVDGDDRSTSRPAGATDSDVTSTSQQAAAEKDGASTNQIAEDKVRTSITDTVATWSRRARDLVVSRRKMLCRRPRHDDGSVDVVPAAVVGIGKLTALHTLGVVNVSGGAGAFLLKELKKLTQLRKLGVSGINRKNWHDLCSTISGHGHLESLSVWFDDEQDLFYFDDDLEPPKTLKSLKLYGGGNGNGNVHVSPVWLKQLGDLEKVHFELTISTQEDIDSLMELPCQDMFRHLLVKPIRDCELHYGRRENFWRGGGFKAATVLKIDCGSYKLKIGFGDWIPRYVEVLVVHCSSTTESSIEISGLDRLPRLKKVRLEGSCSEAVKQHVQQVVAEHRRNLS